MTTQEPSVRVLTSGRFLRFVVVLVLVGVPLGGWWWAVAPPVVATWGGTGFFPIQTEPDGYIAADLQFGLWMLLFGVAASRWSRRRWLASPVTTLLALVLGCLGAAALAALVGGWLGPSATPDVLVGTRVEGPLRLRSPGLLLIGSIAAVAWWFAADLAASWREEGSAAEGDVTTGDDATSDATADATADEANAATQVGQSEPSSPTSG